MFTQLLFNSLKISLLILYQLSYTPIFIKIGYYNGIIASCLLNFL